MWNVFFIILAVSAVSSPELASEYSDFLASGGASASGLASSTLSVTWDAPFQSGGGYCSEATAFLLGLSALPNVDVRVRQHGDSYNPDYLRGLPPADAALLARALTSGAERWHHPDVSVCHSEPGAWHLPPTHPARYHSGALPCPNPAARVRVGRTMFESDRLPAGWAERCNAMDEIWVPTAFAAKVFAAGGVEMSKLRIVPEAVDAMGAFNPQAAAAPPASDTVTDTTTTSLLPPRTANITRFLFVGKFERRKGLDILLAAFATAFGRGGGGGAGGAPAQLWVLTSAYHSSSDFEAEVASVFKSLACDSLKSESGRQGGRHLCLPHDLATSPPPIYLLSGVPQSSLPSVYASVDALVQPSRGEGWGRPHVEAMAMGLPVIATHWSGPSAYLDETVGYPLAHTGLSEIKDGPFAGHLMADPDAFMLVDALKAIVRDRDVAREKGTRARRKMIEMYSPRDVGAFVAVQMRRLVERARAKKLHHRISRGDSDTESL